MKKFKHIIAIIVVACVLLGINNIDHSRKKIELNIGYQSITAQTWGALIIKNTHMLENKLKKYYPDREIVVNWYDEVSGSVINNNMIAHKYQIGFMGDMACIINLSQSISQNDYNAKLIAFDGKGKRGKNQSILVNKNSEINDLKDLKGKTVSVPLGSSAYRMLIDILNKEELLEYVNIVHQDIPTACNMLITGKIDALAAWEPYVTEMQMQKKMSELVSGEMSGKDYLAGLIVDTDWMNKYNQVENILLECVDEVHNYLNNYPVESSKIICRESNFSFDTVYSVIQSVQWESEILSKDRNTLVEDKNFLVEKNEINDFSILEYIKK